MKKDLVEDEELLTSLLKTASRREAFPLLLAKYQQKSLLFSSEHELRARESR